jgi:hypothetical protein
MAAFIKNHTRKLKLSIEPALTTWKTVFLLASLTQINSAKKELK